jgi:hypothetical protein
MGVLLLATPVAWGHHSFAQYDGSKLVELKGTVVRFQWSNPHADEYSVECASVAMLSRIGWTAKSLRAGERITVVVHPGRNPALLGVALFEATKEDGTRLAQTQIQLNRHNEAIATKQDTDPAH